MNDKTAPQSRKLVRQPAGPVDGRRRKRGLTRAVKTAIDAMMFDRCTRDEACQRAGFTERALYLALAKPEVAQYWNAQLHVLRTGERARNISRLAELRDQDENRAAAVKAVQVLEGMAEGGPARGPNAPTVPGLVIVVVNRSDDVEPPHTINLVGGAGHVPTASQKDQ